MYLFTENNVVAFGLTPIADVFDTVKSTDVVNAENFHHVVFLIYLGLATGGTATATITVEACDDVVPTNTTTIPFKYRRTSGVINAGDTQGAVTDAAAAGFTTTAGSYQVYTVEVDCAQLGALGRGFVRLKATEGVNDPVVGCVLTILCQPRHAINAPATVIA